MYVLRTFALDSPWLVLVHIESALNKKDTVNGVLSRLVSIRFSSIVLGSVALSGQNPLLWGSITPKLHLVRERGLEPPRA